MTGLYPLKQQLKKLYEKLLRWAAPYPWLHRWLCSPIPFLEPYRRKHLAVRRAGGLGDVLMCTPALYAAWQRNPQLRITFYADYPEILKGLPFIHEVCPLKQAPPHALRFRYWHLIPPPRHIARLFAEQIGIHLQDVRPHCVVDEAVLQQLRTKIPEGLPVITIQRQASSHTPNKNWPDAYWDELISLLQPDYIIIEIGQEKTGGQTLLTKNYLDWRGLTTLPELVALLKLADLHVGPVSSPVHIAAAVGTPCVVIYGGYESPVCSHYEGHIQLFTDVPCAPCWLRTPCPYDKKCLSVISPTTVLLSIQKMLQVQTAHGTHLPAENTPVLSQA